MPKSTTTTASEDLEAGMVTAALPSAPPTQLPPQQEQIREEEETTGAQEELAGTTTTKPPLAPNDKDGDGENGEEPPVLERVSLLRGETYGSCDHPEDGDEDPLIQSTRAQCLGLLRKAFYVVMPLSIVASIFACMYGWIYVNTPRYLEDPGAWQRCVVYNQAPTTANPVPTPQNFAVSASAFGGMMFIFMGLGFKAGYLALQDMDLLPYSLTVTCYTLLGQMVYRPVNPVLPAITELTPTLVSLTYFIHPGMYTAVPGGGEACTYAYRVNACFLGFVFILFAANIFNLGVQVYAAIRTRRVPRLDRYVLVWATPALVFVGLAMLCYILTIAAKEDAALKTLFLLGEVNHGYLFPFVRPTLDTVGLFLLLTVASVIYGACKQQPESFKWAAFTAYVHVLLSYPILISNFQAYHLYGFWSDSGCIHFLKTDTTHAGGKSRQQLFAFASALYPETVDGFCRDTRVALVGQFAQFVLMHLAVVGCLVVVMANWRMEPPSMQLHLFGSKASSFLFPNVPPGQEGLADGGGGEENRRASTTTGLQEPLLVSSGPGEGLRPQGAGGAGGAGLHHRRQSSGAGSVLSQRSQHARRSSLNDHLLGPVLD